MFAEIETVIDASEIPNTDHQTPPATTHPKGASHIVGVGKLYSPTSSVGFVLAVVRLLVLCPLMIAVGFRYNFGQVFALFWLVILPTGLVSLVEAVIVSFTGKRATHKWVCWLAFIANTFVSLDFRLLAYIGNAVFESRKAASPFG